MTMTKNSNSELTLGSCITSKLGKLLVVIVFLSCSYILIFRNYESSSSLFNVHPTISKPNSTIVESQVAIKHDENKITRRVQSILEGSEKVWSRYVKKRHELVGKNPEEVDPWPPTFVIYFWDYFLPTYTCPHLIERIGGLGDGGKWVCGIDLYEDFNLAEEEASVNSVKSQSCIIYSFGVATEYSFEIEMVQRCRNCEVYAYDASVNNMGDFLPASERSRIHFHKRFIGSNNTNESSTLMTLMKENGHEWIDFLKMDVEGSEFGVLSQIMDEFETLPFSQMQLEVHGSADGKNFAAWYRIWERMEGKGLRAFKNEMNHWPCVRRKMKPIYAEYSFINVKESPLNKLIQ